MEEPRPRLVGLEVGDDDHAWRAAGFTVRGGRIAVGGVVISLVGSQGGRGLRGWSLWPPASGDCDGLPLVEPPAAAGTATGAESATGAAGPGAAGPGGEARRDPGVGDEQPTHPNGVTALDHVVVTSDDIERTTRALAALGCSPRRTTVGARGDGDDDIAYRFFLLGTCVLELVGPTGSRGPGPARFAGLAFTTGRLDELGELAGTPRDAVQPGRRIATLRTEPLGISVPTVLLSPRPGRGARPAAG